MEPNTPTSHRSVAAWLGVQVGRISAVVPLLVCTACGGGNRDGAKGTGGEDTGSASDTGTGATGTAATAGSAGGSTGSGPGGTDTTGSASGTGASSGATTAGSGGTTGAPVCEDLACPDCGGVLWGTSNDDIPHGAVIRGADLYVIGTRYDSFFGIDQGQQFLRLSRLDAATGSSLALLTGECKTSILNPIEVSHGEKIAADANGGLYVAGHLRCDEMCISQNGTKKCVSGEIDGTAFLVKLSADLTPLWTETQESGGEDKAEAVGVSPDGSTIYVAGHYAGGKLKLDGNTVLNSQGAFDVYVVSYTADGSPTGAAVGVGGGEDDGQPALAVAADGSVYVTGYMRSTPTVVYDGNGVLATLDPPAGGSDVFVVKLGPDLSLAWALRFGSTGDDKGVAIAAGPPARPDDVYVAGYYEDAPLELPGCCNAANAGGRDGFLARLSADGTFAMVRSLGGPGTDRMEDVAVDPASGRIFVAGHFGDAFDLDACTVGPSAGRDGVVFELDRDGTVHGVGIASGPGADEATVVTAGSGVVWAFGHFDQDGLGIGGTTIDKTGKNVDAFQMRVEPAP